MQFLTAFLWTIGLLNSAKLPELQLKFDDHIAGNHIFKVPVFKISQSARTPLNGSRCFTATLCFSYLELYFQQEVQHFTSCKCSTKELYMLMGVVFVIDSILHLMAQNVQNHAATIEGIVYVASTTVIPHRHSHIEGRAVARTLIGGGGVYIHIFRF